MGVSITILEKEGLVLSTEIDKEVTLEVSTGFVVGPRATHLSIGMKVTAQELREVIDKLQEVYDDLLLSHTCSNCGLIRHKDYQVCPECSHYACVENE